MPSLPRIRSGLLYHKLDEQTLVYDSRDDRIHLLDQMTAHVFEMLQNECGSLETLHHDLGRILNIQADPSMVALAVDQLLSADLIETPTSQESEFPGINRRELVQKMAAAGIAAVLIPTIATLGAPKAYAQSSQTNLPNGSPCTQDSQCATGICNGAPAFNNTCQPCQPQGNTQGVCNRQLECCVGGTCRPDNNQKCA